MGREEESVNPSYHAAVSGKRQDCWQYTDSGRWGCVEGRNTNRATQQECPEKSLIRSQRGRYRESDNRALKTKDAAQYASLTAPMHTDTHRDIQTMISFHVSLEGGLNYSPHHPPSRSLCSWPAARLRGQRRQRLTTTGRVCISV